MQIILQATHGVVSGEPDFFKRAFGDTVDDYRRILLLPHDFIFNRDWYERFSGRAELDEYKAVASHLHPEDQAELLGLLSSCDPRYFERLSQQTTNSRVKSILPFYVPKPKQELYRIWEQQKALLQSEATPPKGLTDEERVEDAGLEDDDVQVEPVVTKIRKTGTRRATV